MRRALSLALAAAVVAGGTLAPMRAARAADKSTYVLLKAGTLIDGSGSAPRRNVDVLVKDGRIESIGGNLTGPPGTTTIDLAGYTVLPGLIDCHTHLTLSPDGPGAMLREVAEGPADAAIRGVQAARRPGRRSRRASPRYATSAPASSSTSRSSARSIAATCPARA